MDNFKWSEIKDKVSFTTADIRFMKKVYSILKSSRLTPSVARRIINSIPAELRDGLTPNMLLMYRSIEWLGDGQPLLNELVSNIYYNGCFTYNDIGEASDIDIRHALRCYLISGIRLDSIITYTHEHFLKHETLLDKDFGIIMLKIFNNTNDKDLDEADVDFIERYKDSVKLIYSLLGVHSQVDRPEVRLAKAMKILFAVCFKHVFTTSPRS